MPDDAPDLARAAAALHRQWAVLRPWVRDLLRDVPGLAQRPSVLAGWSVADLVAHLGRAMDALAAVRPAPPSTPPLSLARYVGGYAAGAAAIADVTRALAAEIADDPLAGVDRLVDAAWRHLAALGPDDRVVMARRGPVMLTDMVVSRVLELVVHADDLTRSVPERPAAPIDPGALDLVAGALARVLRDAGGPAVEVRDPLAWVRVAAGRTAADADAVTRAVDVTTSGATPADVVRRLPLL